jgi:hypothetical protein
VLVGEQAGVAGRAGMQHKAGEGVCVWSTLSNQGNCPILAHTMKAPPPPPGPLLTCKNSCNAKTADCDSSRCPHNGLRLPRTCAAMQPSKSQNNGVFVLLARLNESTYPCSTRVFTCGRSGPNHP